MRGPPGTQPQATSIPVPQHHPLQPHPPMRSRALLTALPRGLDWEKCDRPPSAATKRRRWIGRWSRASTTGRKARRTHRLHPGRHRAGRGLQAGRKGPGMIVERQSQVRRRRAHATGAARPGRRHGGHSVDRETIGGGRQGLRQGLGSRTRPPIAARCCERLRESVPPETWDDLPTDLAKNKKHYLYGHPREDGRVSVVFADSGYWIASPGLPRDAAPRTRSMAAG